jgi:hypothetical protein
VDAERPLRQERGEILSFGVAATRSPPPELARRPHLVTACAPRRKQSGDHLAVRGAPASPTFHFFGRDAVRWPSSEAVQRDGQQPDELAVAEAPLRPHPLNQIMKSCFIYVDFGSSNESITFVWI